MPKPLLDHFGVVAPFYEHVVRPPDTRGLVSWLDLMPGQLLLDVGGGTGRVTQYLQRNGARLLVLDPSRAMLRQAQAKECCMVAQGIAERLPFADGCFARIVAVDSFHHFWNQATAAGELVRVLAPGGRLVIEEFDVRRFWVRLVALAERLALMRSRFFAPGDLVTLFRTLDVAVQVHFLPRGSTYWAVIEKTV